MLRAARCARYCWEAMEKTFFDKILVFSFGIWYAVSGIGRLFLVLNAVLPQKLIQAPSLGRRKGAFFP